MDFVNVAHLHLLLNHIPTIGSACAIGLLLLALIRRNDHLRQASLEVFFLVALMTLPAYLTGVAAAAAIEGRADVSEAAMDAHHDGALAAFLLMQITGLLAWLALWQRRRQASPPAWPTAAVLLSAVVTLALMAGAGTLGGEIRHPEIRLDENVVAGRGWLNVSSIVNVVSDTPWVWPAAETLHFLAMSLLFGVLMVVNLRILGVMKAVPFAALHRLLPWGILALGVNIITGMLFFITAAEQYVNSAPFYWKIAALVPAGANLLYVTVVDRAWALEAGDDAQTADKAMAASAIGLWVAVMFFGRMLPFLGTSF